MRYIASILFFIFALVLLGYVVSHKKFEGDVIRLGMSGPFSGGLNSVGNQFLLGSEIYLKNLNEEGGIHGRKIEIIAKDDRYEPKLAIENAHAFIKQEKVFAFFGIIGTPSAEVMFPIAIKERIPFVGAYSGAEFLRKPVNPIVLNARASDLDEIEKLVQYYTSVFNHKRFAIFYQNDGYGMAALTGAKSALAKHNLILVGEGSYRRNTLSVGNALYEIEQSNPEVILMAGSTHAVAEFIKRARKSEKIRKEVKFGLSSFVEPKPLIELLKGEGEGIVFAQVVPSPWTSEVQEVEDYRALMHKYYPQEDLSHVSLEGYFAARMISEVFKSIGRSFSKEDFIDALGAFSKSLDENSLPKNRDERCKCLHNVHLSEYVEEDFYSVGNSREK
ncbi:ABC transporter substrate-binding protein [Sulfurospirillum barnesii]|uniref:Amino acid/amide ABC transporter substrate-binding protein, HAAT family n=1 Tax=Sulfurospirillum barnesii (strain ATCC 700032 / DSM 10660 / SES-3) TaxID=760154 RepID=I3XU36_SULBS|nr:ABC transporter substrate-binding protein [Sulfurospirillum barnesii]AFL67460.1 amino acid/amide ABC transporter substrate-binding protein, HAAT family [Sulfurospirillum barnesii SES-3]